MNKINLVSGVLTIISMFILYMVIYSPNSTSSTFSFLWYFPGATIMAISALATVVSIIKCKSRFFVFLLILNVFCIVNFSLPFLLA